MRQAYDYWQDQPGSYSFPKPAPPSWNLCLFPYVPSPHPSRSQPTKPNTNQPPPCSSHYNQCAPPNCRCVAAVAVCPLVNAGPSRQPTPCLAVSEETEPTKIRGNNPNPTHPSSPTPSRSLAQGPWRRSPSNVPSDTQPPSSPRGTNSRSVLQGYPIRVHCPLSISVWKTFPRFIRHNPTACVPNIFPPPPFPR